MQLETQVKGKKTCTRCGSTLSLANFFLTMNPEHADEVNDGKYFYPKCKKCTTSIINVYEPSTYMPLLQDMNVLYDDELWQQTIKKKADSSGFATGVKVLGPYLGAVRLGQYAGLTWADTAERAKDKAHREAVAQAQSEAHRLRFTEALGVGASADLANIDRSLLSPEEISVIFEGSKPSEPELIEGAESRSQLSVGPRTGAGRGTLSDEDAHYLSTKWGALYVEEELLYMERLYHEMTASFEITTASHVDYLKKICKVSHKVEQAIDVNDSDSYNKYARVYDMLMKSAKFTAVQNKVDASAQEESLARAILLAEEHGFIPMHDISVPRDEIDFVLQDLMRYTRKLVTEEAGLGNMIENAVAAMKRQEEETEADMETASTEAPEPILQMMTDEEEVAHYEY